MSDPAITIAGRAWPIPLLAPRQNRIVLPLLSAGAPDYGALADCVFAAITRAHDLSRAEFEDWPVPFFELCAAVPVIAGQTGFMERRRPGAPAGHCEAIDWDAIIAEFCNFLPGTTPDYWEDALTAPRMNAMREQWRLHPPICVIAAAWVGYKPRPRDEDALSELMRLFPTGSLSLHPTVH